MSPFWPQGQVIETKAQADIPKRFSWRYADHRVMSIAYHWRVHSDWLPGGEVWRDYWEVMTDTHLLCVIYHNLLDDEWFLERIYE